MTQDQDMREFDIRGQLAAKLTCWHRLTEKESDELVALFSQEPFAWAAWNDAYGNTLWHDRDEADLYCSHDGEPEPLYKRLEGKP